jgi:hypothetical protein
MVLFKVLSLCCYNFISQNNKEIAVTNFINPFERKILRRIFGPTTQADGTRSRKINE